MPSLYTKPNGTVRGKQRFKPDPSKYLYNVDTFWYNIDCHNYDQNMIDSGLLDDLIDGRNYLADNGVNKTIEVKLPQYAQPLLFEIHGGQPPAYQYSIRTNDIAIYFKKSYREDQEPMKVQINQFLLWNKGIIDAYQESLQVISYLGFQFGKAKLNRCDFAVHSDQYRWNLEDLETLSFPMNFAKDNHPNFYKLNTITHDFETVYYGSRNYINLRIYDKSKEIKDKKKDHFTVLYLEKNMNPDTVWNVEFEVRRDFIKDLKDDEGIPIFDDLEAVFAQGKLNILWSLLMDKFDHPSPHWKQIRQGSKDKFLVTDHNVSRQKEIDWTTKREVGQIYGRSQKFAVLSSDDTLESTVKRIVEELYTYENEKERDYSLEVNNKRRLYHDEFINSLSKKSSFAISHFEFNTKPQWLQDIYLHQGKTMIGGKIVKNEEMGILLNEEVQRNLQREKNKHQVLQPKITLPNYLNLDLISLLKEEQKKRNSVVRNS